MNGDWLNTNEDDASRLGRAFYGLSSKYGFLYMLSEVIKSLAGISDEVSKTLVEAATKIHNIIIGIDDIVYNVRCELEKQNIPLEEVYVDGKIRDISNVKRQEINNLLSELYTKITSSVGHGGEIFDALCYTKDRLVRQIEFRIDSGLFVRK